MREAPRTLRTIPTIPTISTVQDTPDDWDESDVTPDTVIPTEFSTHHGGTVVSVRAYLSPDTGVTRWRITINTADELSSIVLYPDEIPAFATALGLIPTFDRITIGGGE